MPSIVVIAIKFRHLFTVTVLTYMITLWSTKVDIGTRLCVAESERTISQMKIVIHDEYTKLASTHNSSLELSHATAS